MDEKKRREGESKVEIPHYMFTFVKSYPTRVGNLAESVSVPSPALKPATEKMSL